MSHWLSENINTKKISPEQYLANAFSFIGELLKNSISVLSNIQNGSYEA